MAWGSAFRQTTTYSDFVLCVTDSNVVRLSVRPSVCKEFLPRSPTATISGGDDEGSGGATMKAAAAQ
jgi:hypothetical protein